MTRGRVAARRRRRVLLCVSPAMREILNNHIMPEAWFLRNNFCIHSWRITSQPTRRGQQAGRLNDAARGAKCLSRRRQRGIDILVCVAGHRQECLCHLGGLTGHNGRSVQPRRARGTVSTLRRQQTTRPTAAAVFRRGRRLNSANARGAAALSSLRLPFSA